jgi:hypothetical protein
MLFCVLNNFAQLLLSYRNHVINFVVTNPFFIPGFDNIQAPLLHYVTCNNRGINSTSTLRLFLCVYFVPKRLAVAVGGELITVPPGRSLCK